jgi:GTPase
VPTGGIIANVTVRQADVDAGTEPERGFVVAVLAQSADAEEELGELRELARTAGVEPVGELVQYRPRPSVRTYVGKGKLEELKQAYEEARSEVLLVDDELTPPQQRTLENALNARVVDRTQLILDIFAQHAITAEGKLQVELAQLEYNLPRMRGMWQHLERLGGGTGALGAGVGTRGPGESQLETDRRLARRRIGLLRRRLRELSKQREVRRKERTRSQTPVVALAGYTNVGKSTLLNALTDAEVPVRNRLFETLDPTTRAFEHDGRRYLLTDTVGFIRRLPTQLVEGFAATLEETLVADLVLHVADASEPDERLDEMRAAVEAVLHEIGADELPVELVLNKIDAVDPLRRRRLANRFPDALQVSALTGEGLDALRARLAQRFSDRFQDVHLLLPYEKGGKLAELYALGAPIAERADRPEGVFVRARLPRSEVQRWAPYLIAEAEYRLREAETT